MKVSFGVEKSYRSVDIHQSLWLEWKALGYSPMSFVGMELQIVDP